jgi:N-acetylmuramoyl-L-alanine amidase
MSKKVVLNIGHSSSDSGAISPDGKYQEHSYNRDKLGPLVKTALEDLGHDVSVVIQKVNFGELPGVINTLHPHVIISLHLNASDTTGNGVEVLFWNTSKRSKRLAELLQNAIVKSLGLKDRGVKPKTDGDRGAALLKKTNAPCVIAETAFIDNKHDMEVLDAHLSEVAVNIANAVDAFLKE